MSGEDGVTAFRTEAAELLVQIERALLDLDQDLSNTQYVDEVFRGLHTLKGSGAMFGFNALARFTHHCETAFDQVRKGKVMASHALIAVVLSARDHMQALIHAGVDNDLALETEGTNILSALEAAVTQGDLGVAGASVDEPAGFHIRFSLPSGSMVNGTNPLALLDELRALGTCKVVAKLDRVPSLADLDPLECYLHWEVDLRGDMTVQDIEDVFIFVIDDMELTITPLASVEPPRADLVQAPQLQTEKGDNSPKNTVQPAESVRVSAARLDELMNRVGEMVIAQSRLALLAAMDGSIDTLTLRAVSEDIGRLSAELRDTSMAMRMMPVGNLFTRFRRLVHDLSGETGKSIELSTEGEATEVDKTVMECLADPMIHLIRNACDHGLELADERGARGKDPVGHISLSARQTGGEVLITITDDGRGINRQAVRAKAEAQGLIQTGSKLSDQDLLQLIFHPGFSTAAAVTNLSGRGVGMDVVKRSIESLRGRIEIVSHEGVGTTITMHLPLTLAIIECMLVRVGDARFALPLSAVEECIELPASEVAGGAKRNFLDMRGTLVPYVRLRDSFVTSHPPDLFQKVVIVGHGGFRTGLVVDQIIGNTQTVIKSMSRFHVGLSRFSGATILGDGTVALILDVANLIAAEQRQQRLHVDRIGEAA